MREGHKCGHVAECERERERWKSFEVTYSGHLSKVSYVHVLVNAGKASMWTHTLREVSECIRNEIKKREVSDHSLTLAHVGWEVPSIFSNLPFLSFLI